MKTGSTIFDSTYIRTSRRIQCILVTVDEELKERGGKVVEIRHLSELYQPNPSASPPPPLSQL